MKQPPESELLDAINGLFDGTLAPQNVAELAERLSEDEETYALYARLVRLDVSLAWSCGTRPKSEAFIWPPTVALSANENSASTDRILTEPLQVGRLRPARSPGIGSFFSWPILQRVAVVALCVYGAFALVAWNLRSGKLPSGADRSSLTVAMLGASEDARWSSEAAPKADHAAFLPGERLKLDGGIVELELKRGAKLVVQAPAEWTIEGDNKATLHAGKLVATIPPSAIGFTLETPTAKIVDLGTEFAAEVGADQRTQIHVFKGTVVAQQARSSANSNDAVRLSAGEALKTGGPSAPFQSIPIRSDRYVKAAKQKQKSVIDSAQTSAGKLYPVIAGGLRENAQAYTDRSFEWNGIPAELVGADYVQTANDDKRDLNFELYMTLSAPATLYVFFENRAPAPPEWLSKFFTDTGWDIGLDGNPEIRKGAGESVDITYSVWKRHVKRGTVWLGPSVWVGGHYGVAAVADSLTQDGIKAEGK